MENALFNYCPNLLDKNQKIIPSPGEKLAFFFVFFYILIIQFHAVIQPLELER